MGGVLLMCQNTTMRVYGARIKRYCVSCSKHIAVRVVLSQLTAGSRQAAWRCPHLWNWPIVESMSDLSGHITDHINTQCKSCLYSPTFRDWMSQCTIRNPILLQWNLYKTRLNFVVFQGWWSFTTGRVNMILLRLCQVNGKLYVFFCKTSLSHYTGFAVLNYRKTSNISRTLVGNKIVDNSDVVGASPVGAAPTTSSFLT